MAKSGPRLLVTKNDRGFQMLLAVVYLLLGVLVLWPLVMILYGSFHSGSPLSGNAHWTFDGYRRLWQTLLSNGLFWKSALLSALVAALGIPGAIALAFIHARTDAPLKQVIPTLVVISMNISVLFYSISYGLFGNGFNGLLNIAWRHVSGSHAVLFETESWAGIIFVGAICTAAHVYLFLINSFRSFDGRLQEAALVCGASRFRSEINIALPLLLPVLSSVTLVGLIGGLQQYESVVVLGKYDPSITIIGRKIADLITAPKPDYALSSTLGVFLIGLVLLAAWGQHRLLQNRDFTVVTGKAGTKQIARLGPWRWVGTAVVLLFGLVAVIIPLATIVIASLQSFPGRFDRLSLDGYAAVLANPILPQVLITTTLIAVVTGIASAGTAFAVAYLAVRIGGRQGSILRTITLLSLGLPGVAGVIATLWAYVSVPGLRSLYGTTWVMVAALIAGSLTSSVQIVHGALVQISRDLEEASLIAGRDRLQTVFRITMQLLLPTLKSAAFLVGTLVTGNLAVPQLLSAADTRTLALFSYSLYTGGHQTQAAVLLVVWVGFVLSLVITWKIASSLFRVLVFALRHKNSSSHQSDKKTSGVSAFAVGIRPSTNPLERPVAAQTQGASR